MKKKPRLGGGCKLCNQPTEKFSKSHIQPHWLVRDRAPTGDFYVISSDDPFKRQQRTGIYDFFLCPTCEDNSSQYDDYAASFFRSADQWKVEMPHGFTFRVVLSYDYRRLKLFMMNVLFRSAATTQAFFEAVKLEPTNFDKLREMVRSEQPGDIDDFAVIINMRTKFAGLERVGEAPKRFTDEDGNSWYRFDLNEFPCDIKTNCAPSNHSKELILKPTPPLLIYEGPIALERMERLRKTAIDRVEREQAQCVIDPKFAKVGTPQLD